MSTDLTCSLCGTTNRDVVHQIVRYLEPVEGEFFGTIFRCKDRAKCRRTVELAGEPWTVNDGVLR